MTHEAPKDPTYNPEWTEEENRTFDTLDQTTGLLPGQIVRIAKSRNSGGNIGTSQNTEGSNVAPVGQPPKGRRSRIDLRKLGPRERLIADKGPQEVEEELERLKHEPLTEEERLIGAEESRKILESLQGGKPT